MRVQVRFEDGAMAFERCGRDISVLARHGYVSPAWDRHGLRFVLLHVPRQFAVRVMRAALPVNFVPWLVSKNKMTGLVWPEFAGKRLQPRGRIQAHHSVRFGGEACL
jgi:hypothetical protein